MQEAYGEKYSSRLMMDSKRDTSRLLEEAAEAGSFGNGSGRHSTVGKSLPASSRRKGGASGSDKTRERRMILRSHQVRMFKWVAA